MTQKDGVRSAMQSCSLQSNPAMHELSFEGCIHRVNHRCRMQDGTLHKFLVLANSTVTVLPKARHQMKNTGDTDLTFIVAFDNPPMRPIAYPSWDAPAGKPLFPLFWDRECPTRYPVGVKEQAIVAGQGRSEL